MIVSRNVKAYAKVNLFLDVTEKLSNGYHNLNSIMQEVSLCDDITVSVTLSDAPADCNIIVLCRNTDDIPSNEKNLAWKAADMFIKAFGTGIYYPSEIHIEIIKNIPSPGGLGGGSADCAAVLNALNDIFELHLSFGTLSELGAKIGSDVPFCIKGCCAVVNGCGEIVESIDIKYPENCCFLIANAGIGMPTPLAFHLLDEKFNGFSSGEYIDGTDQLRTFESAVSAVQNGSYEDLCGCTYNIFEEIIKTVRPEINTIFDIINSNDADSCFLSGSGPSVIGIFTDQVSLTRAYRELSSRGVKCWTCKPITKLSV